MTMHVVDPTLTTNPQETYPMKNESLVERVSAIFASDPEHLADPFPTWKELLDTQPVLRVPQGVVLSRHEDVQQLLGDNNKKYSRARTRDAAMYHQAKDSFAAPEQEAFDAVLEQEFRQLVRMDPPDHPRLRRAVLAPFTPRALEREMEDRIDQRIEQGLAELEAADGPVDFKRFAYTLPFRVIGDLLGIHIEDLDLVHTWAKAIADNKFNADSGQMALEADTAYKGLIGYIEDLVAEQRASDEATGLVASMIEAEDSGHVAHDEVAAMLGLMIFAGHETTSNLLSIGFLELLRHDDQWKALRDDPDLAPQATDELVRFVSPVQFLPYTAEGDRVIGDVEVRDGETIWGVLASANRDPDVFDHPDDLDIRRTDIAAHIGFGLGPHFCLGQGLAKMEATKLFHALAERYPDASLVSEDLRWGGRALRTPLSLPVRLTA